MTESPLRIGTRGSLLALWQAEHVASRIVNTSGGIPCTIVKIKTTGDVRTDVPLSRVGGKGLFTKEIENALLDGTVDIAVHSLKDMTTILPEGLFLGAVLEREDPRDALLFPVHSTHTKFQDLPSGASVGTSSLRRKAQLLALRPDLHIEDLRGNLDTRLRKLDEGAYDAIVLAAAGLRRLGHGRRINHFFKPEEMLHAVGQGAIGIEIRARDERALQSVAALDHEPTRRAVETERLLLEKLEGGCQVPIGVHTHKAGKEIDLEAAVFSLEGNRSARARETGQTPQETAQRVYESLLQRGAGEILNRIRSL